VRPLSAWAERTSCRRGIPEAKLFHEKPPSASGLSRFGTDTNCRMMLCKVTKELGLCLIHKNASTSVRAARPMRPVTPSEFLVLPRRVALLREPHDRFASTWRDYRQRRDVRLTFEEFSEAAFSRGFPFKTPELVPQVKCCALANEFIRWDFAEISALLEVAIPSLNRTEREPLIWPAEIKKEFAERYAADLALWEQRPLPRDAAVNWGVTFPPDPLHRY
jgi:hypothetical protein